MADNPETREFLSAYRRGRERVMANLEKAWAEASKLGWKAEEVFMLRQRVDQSGLVGLLDAGDEIVAVEADSIEIVTVNGAHQKYYRKDYSHPWQTKAEPKEEKP